MTRYERSRTEWDDCGFCHDARPVAGDVLCARCRAAFEDDFEVGEQTDYQKRIAAEAAMRERMKEKP